jgi:ABC-type nickel/cobalt efflux system permease component RcnA
MHPVLEVFVYMVVILTGWTIWLLIRKQFDKRAERIRKMRDDQKAKVDAAINLAKEQEEEEKRQKEETEKALKKQLEDEEKAKKEALNANRKTLKKDYSKVVKKRK